MRIAVTGANGFLGSAVCRAVEKAGYVPMALTRVDGDLSDPGAAASLADRAAVEADGVIHAAAKADFTLADTHPFTRPNVVATALLAEACAANRKPFVYVSAAVIAPGPEIGPDTPDAPPNGYILSKLLGERAALALWPEAASLRIGGIYGLGGPGHLGLNKALAAALDGQPPTIFGSGRARRNYIHVDDAARALIAALTEGWRGVHLIAGHEILTVERMMTDVARIVAKAEPKYLPGEEGADMVVTPSGKQPPCRPFVDVLTEMAGRR